MWLSLEKIVAYGGVDLYFLFTQLISTWNEGQDYTTKNLCMMTSTVCSCSV